MDAAMYYDVEIDEIDFSMEVEDGRELEIEAESRVVMEKTVLDPYEGPYEVTPTVGGFFLATEGKAMSEDLAVLAIPVYETGNEYGETIHIAPTA